MVRNSREIYVLIELGPPNPGVYLTMNARASYKHVNPAMHAFLSPLDMISCHQVSVHIYPWNLLRHKKANYFIANDAFETRKVFSSIRSTIPTTPPMPACVPQPLAGCQIFTERSITIMYRIRGLNSSPPGRAEQSGRNLAPCFLAQKGQKCDGHYTHTGCRIQVV
jgi:hypothetical protein